MDLSTNLGRLKLPNPFMAASGTYGFGIEWDALSAPDEFGAIVTKGIFINPKKGNPAPRLAETSCGLINSIGLEGPGIDLFLDFMLPKTRELGVKTLVNINGETIEEYGELASRLNGVEGIDGIEINVSCPNLETGGMAFGVDSDCVYKISRLVRKSYSGPILVKLTPNVADIRIQAKAAIDAGVDALTVANTYTGMAIDTVKRTSRIGRNYGGYSGPALKPLTLKLVHQVYSEFKFPVIASGGVYNLCDCLEYFIAGATAVMLGTVNYIDPMRVVTLKNELVKFLETEKSSFKDLIGSYREPPKIYNAD